MTPTYHASPYLFWATLILALFCGSCRSRFKSTYPVRGSVFYEGKPAAGAKVFFKSLDFPEDGIAKPMAEVDKEGAFTLTTYKVDDGAPAGSYAVTFIWLPKGYVGPLEKGNKLPMRYADPEKSGFKVQVETHDNEFPRFELNK